MGHGLRKILGAVLGLTVALSGVAYAETVVYPTEISVARRPTGAVSPGTVVHIYGKLSSEKLACIRNSKIQLIRVGKGVVARTATDLKGRYAFDRKVRNTSRWRVRFPGKVLNAVHPHNRTCGASSAGFRIRVS
jgi:hypothetical protein